MDLQDFDSLKFSPERLRHIVALTGAGISAESGVPTFRGEAGFWKTHRPEELATPQAFKANPTLVWEWYFYRRQLISQAEPNAGHFALAELEKMPGTTFTLITQNVDGLHRQAGSRNPIELHGNIFVNRCNDCAQHFSDDELNFENLPPHCPSCGGLVRPGVVWFGENLNPVDIEDAFMKSQQATLFLAIGTSAVVHPAASLPQLAQQNGAFLIEINPDSTPLSPLANVTIRQPAARAMPQLVAKMREELQKDH